MRIAQVSPLYESVPPERYGGTERVVSYLTEELVRQGHDITLFASGDSRTSAQLVPIAPKALRPTDCTSPVAYHVLMIERIVQMASQFDLIHFHIDFHHFPVSRHCSYVHLTTLHGRLDIPELEPLFREFNDMPVVSISDAQRIPLPLADWIGTVYHGLPQGLHRFCPKAGQYLAFIGRISPEKRVDRAIEIARRAGLPLKIAAKVDNADREYFASQIKPLLAQPHVEFVGEIRESQKSEFLGQAMAVLFPIDWPEPFGLVMIEAMACGTPVIAFRGGSVEEIITSRRNGFVCNNIDEAVEAVHNIGLIDRRDCRHIFEDRFTATRMACDYVRIYRKLLGLRPHDERSNFDVGTVLDSGSLSTA